MINFNLEESMSTGSNAPLNPLQPYSSSASYLQIGTANSLNNSFRVSHSDGHSRSYSNENSLNNSNSGEFDDSFTLQVPSAPSSPPTFGASSRHQDAKKKTSGMSLGFSMPMIDLNNEDDDD